MAKKVYVVKFRIKLILLLLFLGYFFSIVIQQELDMRKQMDRINHLEDQISQAQVENEIIKRQIHHTQSDEFIEQAARDKLGWVKDGEKIFIEKKDN